MRKPRAGLSRLAGIFNQSERAPDPELADELEGHLPMHTEENLTRGMTPEEARRHPLISSAESSKLSKSLANEGFSL
jgi:macrolide transport system ATP-binding/permease protein